MTDKPFVPRKPLADTGEASVFHPNLDKHMQRYLRDDFFFLNIGANDGVSNDPIYPYLLTHPGWRGVAVEPVRHNFAQLEHNFRSFPNVTLVNAAISEEKRTFYYLDEDSPCDQAWVSQISSFDKDYVLSSLKGLRQMGPAGILTDTAEQDIRADNSIVCMSLDTLIEECAIEQVDFLNIDAEGSDFEIFTRFDFERFKPTVICIETAVFSPSEREYFATVIADHQYQFISPFGMFSEVYALACGHQSAMP